MISKTAFAPITAAAFFPLLSLPVQAVEPAQCHFDIAGTYIEDFDYIWRVRLAPKYAGSPEEARIRRDYLELTQDSKIVYREDGTGLGWGGNEGQFEWSTKALNSDRCRLNTWSRDQSTISVEIYQSDKGFCYELPFEHEVFDFMCIERIQEDAE